MKTQAQFSLVNENQTSRYMLFHTKGSVNLVLSWCEKLKIRVKVIEVPHYKGWQLFPECTDDEIDALIDKFNTRPFYGRRNL